MLISKRGDDLTLVTQVDHGALAGDLAKRWGNEDFERPAPAGAVHLAASMHDEGWREADGDPLFNDEAHRPLTFLELPPAKHAPLYKRGVDRVFDLDPYAGLLVSMHWTGIYRSRWGMQQPPVVLPPAVVEATATVIEAEERRWAQVKTQLLAGARRSDWEQRLWHNYDLLQVWDLLSLYVCLTDLSPADASPARAVHETLGGLEHPPAVRTISDVPVRVGGPRVDLTLRVVDAGVIEVDPYPFDDDEIGFSVTSRQIADRTYPSADDAGAAFQSAEEERITCRMTRPS